jgi:hypothetical protein
MYVATVPSILASINAARKETEKREMTDWMKDEEYDAFHVHFSSFLFFYVRKKEKNVHSYSRIYIKVCSI